jgi:sec-independent protein translocase protein TatA
MIVMTNSIYLFLNLGGGEVFLIVIVILMLFGSDKLPGIAKGVGKGLRELNDAKNELQNHIEQSTNGLAEEIKQHTSEIQSEIDKAKQGLNKQVEEIVQKVEEEGKVITDTTKEIS